MPDNVSKVRRAEQLKLVRDWWTNAPILEYYGASVAAVMAKLYAASGGLGMTADEFAAAFAGAGFRVAETRPGCYWFQTGHFG